MLAWKVHPKHTRTESHSDEEVDQRDQVTIGLAVEVLAGNQRPRCLPAVEEKQPDMPRAGMAYHERWRLAGPREAVRRHSGTQIFGRQQEVVSAQKKEQEYCSMAPAAGMVQNHRARRDFELPRMGQGDCLAAAAPPVVVQLEVPGDRTVPSSRYSRTSLTRQRGVVHSQDTLHSHANAAHIVLAGHNPQA
jgi:hypothetical protein